MDRAVVAERLTLAGCVFPDVEAEALLLAAGDDHRRQEYFLRRRESGEPMAWITGFTSFCGCSVKVATGVYVPRPHSENLAMRAASVLPQHGRAIDLGTGNGAVALVMQSLRPEAKVMGVECDHVAAECARSNQVTVAEGDLFAPVPRSWWGGVDVITGVLPYVPTRELAYLPHDVLAFEPRRALDGGDDGLGLVGRACQEAPRWLRPGGHLLMEVGGDQANRVHALLQTLGLDLVELLRDEDHDLRGLHAVLGTSS
ncbi:MAG: N5-glutamine methyltransferase family protein [Candidatus Dormibacteria bacterium]